jgi:hypothetical protein
MEPNPHPSPVQPGGVPPFTPVTKRRRWWLYGLGGFFTVLILIAATVAFTLWWIQRPIKPTVLSAQEKAVVETKLQHLGEAGTNQPARLAKAAAPQGVQDPVYVPGGKELRITERELNGLLNENTELGQTVRIELGRDAINAYVVVPIPEDFPVGGGKMFRARGRFRVSYSAAEAPYAILEDVTVFGLSLPKAWLGGLKGENLLANALGEEQGERALRGVKSLKVVPGAIVLEVEE